jgi:hypothetical protein
MVTTGTPVESRRGLALIQPEQAARSLAASKLARPMSLSASSANLTVLRRAVRPMSLSASSANLTALRRAATTRLGSVARGKQKVSAPESASPPSGRGRLVLLPTPTHRESNPIHLAHSGCLPARAARARRRSRLVFGRRRLPVPPPSAGSGSVFLSVVDGATMSASLMWPPLRFPADQSSRRDTTPLLSAISTSFSRF